MNEPADIARIAAAAADSKKAADTVVIDVTGKSDVCDYLVICTTTSNPQNHAVIDAVEEDLREQAGVKPLEIEGRGKGWTLLDYGPVVVHVFDEEHRDYYRLDRLWGDAPRVEVEA